MRESEKSPNRVKKQNSHKRSNTSFDINSPLQNKDGLILGESDEELKASQALEKIAEE